MADRNIAETFLSKLKSSPFVMLGLTGTGEHSEPLTAQIDDDRPNALFFFVGRDNRAIGGGEAMMQFAAKGHDLFACLHGRIARHDDRAQIAKLWSKQTEAWFPGGKDDANLALLRFDIDSAEIWETDMSLSGKVKMLFGGKIDPSDEGSHAVLDTVA